MNATLSFGTHLLWNKIRRKHTPFIVQLTLLNACNFKCDYCYAEYYKRGGKQLPFDQVTHILDELARHQTMRVNLVGGEPLLRKDIDDIVSYGNDQGLMMVMTTNGSFVKKKIETIKKLYSLCISLDGRREGNDKNRGLGTFDQAMEAIDLCSKECVPLNLSAVLTKYSVNDVDFLVELAGKHNAWIDFTTLISQEREGIQPQNDLSPSRKDLDRALKKIIQHKQAGAPIGFSADAYRHALTWHDYSVPFVDKDEPIYNGFDCYAGRDYIFIDYNGDIYPCPQQVGIMKAGNIFTDGFDAAYEENAHHDCKSCPQPCTTDLSYFFALKPSVLLSKYRQSQRPKTWHS